MDTRDLLVRFGIQLGRRFTRKEKQVFLGFIQQHFRELGYTSKALMGKTKRRESINLYVGNIAKAKTIVIAHYDTPVRIFFRKTKFYPFDSGQAYFASLVQTFFPTLIFSIIGVFIFRAGMTAWTDNLFSLVSIATIVGLIFLGVLSFVIARGIGNINNLNMNSAAIVACIKMAEKMPSKNRDEIAFVLTDNECVGRHGDNLVLEALPSTIGQRQIIHLRCIGDGEVIVVGCKESNKDLSKKFKKHYKGEKQLKQIALDENEAKLTALNTYPKSISIAAAYPVGNQYVVFNTQTAKDIEVDLDNIETISDACVALAQEK